MWGGRLEPAVDDEYDGCRRGDGFAMVRCPGQDQRFWKPEDIFEIRCLGCNCAVEFFKDEPVLKCPGCGRMIVNSRLDLSCAEWCQHAEQCLGAARIRNVEMVRDKLIGRMKEVFGQDEKRVGHALRVLNYAERIGEAEGGDPLVIKAAAILHDIGIHEAERKYGSAAGKYQEHEGPPIAESILKDNAVDSVRIRHIGVIIANHHSARDIDTLEFKIVWDADWLVNLQEDFAGLGRQEGKAKVEKMFQTDTGRRMAMELFSSEETAATGSRP